VARVEARAKETNEPRARERDLRSERRKKSERERERDAAATVAAAVVDAGKLKGLTGTSPTRRVRGASGRGAHRVAR